MVIAIQKTENVLKVLKYTYGLVPIVAGLDKFTNILANWNDYVSPALASMLPVSTATFISIIGIVEIVAGALVLFRPRIGGYVVMGWLALIAVTLIFGGHPDIAVRDLVMAVGAFALAQLATAFDKRVDV
jgi:hypothetical protein